MLLPSALGQTLALVARSSAISNHSPTPAPDAVTIAAADALAWRTLYPPISCAARPLDWGIRGNTQKQPRRDAPHYCVNLIFRTLGWDDRLLATNKRPAPGLYAALGLRITIACFSSHHL